MQMKKIYPLLLLAALACSCGPSMLNTKYESDDDDVNLGYQRIRRRDSNSATSTVKVERGSGYTNIYDYLEGRVAGLIVDGTSIRIRGDRSILGSNEPLILVDGIEMDDISDISPNEVERVDVLKDASSTALYGSRGANGVILITTRKSIE